MPSGSLLVELGLICPHFFLELVEPEVKSAIIALRGVPFIAPVGLTEGRIGHIGRRTHVRCADWLGPFRALGRPVIVWEVVVRVVKEPVERRAEDGWWLAEVLGADRAVDGPKA